MPSSPAPTLRSAWPDALALFAALALARAGEWTAADLLWSLWLSSVVLGVAVALWRTARTLLIVTVGTTGIVTGVAADLPEVRRAASSYAPLRVAAVGGITIVGALLSLAIFVLFFGAFQFVHSQALFRFFPVPGAPPGFMADPATYATVLRNYWMFLPAAFLAERRAFVPLRASREVAARETKRGMSVVWLNVLRMHILIYAFAFAFVAELEHFPVYVLVYLLYFVPWGLARQLLKRPAHAAGY